MVLFPLILIGFADSTLFEQFERSPRNSFSSQMMRDENVQKRQMPGAFAAAAAAGKVEHGLTVQMNFTLVMRSSLRVS